MHTYYIVMLAPPLSALTGIGVRTLWISFKENSKNWFLLPVAFLLTVVWQIYIWSAFKGWESVVCPILVLGVGLSIAGLVGIKKLVQKNDVADRWFPISFVIGLVILFISPTVWSLTAVLVPDHSVEANPNLLSGDRGDFGRRGWGEDQNTQKLISFLKANQNGAKYLVFGQNSQSVSPMIIQTGEPAISIGGFMGRDPTISLGQFLHLVKEHQVRYILLGGMGWGGRPGNNLQPNEQGTAPVSAIGPMASSWGGGWGNEPNGPRAEITQWVLKHGKKVDPAMWRLLSPPQPQIDSNSGLSSNNQNTGFGGHHRGNNRMDLYELDS